MENIKTPNPRKIGTIYSEPVYKVFMRLLRQHSLLFRVIIMATTSSGATLDDVQGDNPYLTFTTSDSGLMELSFGMHTSPFHNNPLEENRTAIVPRSHIVHAEVYRHAVVAQITLLSSILKKKVTTYGYFIKDYHPDDEV